MVPKGMVREGGISQPSEILYEHENSVFEVLEVLVTVGELCVECSGGPGKGESTVFSGLRSAL